MNALRRWSGGATGGRFLATIVVPIGPETVNEGVSWLTNAARSMCGPSGQEHPSAAPGDGEEQDGCSAQDFQGGDGDRGGKRPRSVALRLQRNNSASGNE